MELHVAISPETVLFVLTSYIYIYWLLIFKISITKIIHAYNVKTDFIHIYIKTLFPLSNFQNDCTTPVVIIDVPFIDDLKITTKESESEIDK